MLKEIFLNKLKQKHPDNFNKYDYSSVPDEFKVIDKISIKCLTHGMFTQQAYSHSKSYGCIKCGIQNTSNHKKINTLEFIKRANNKHNNKYDYNKTIYIDSKTKVIITCSIHGDFEQTPNDHINGYGCSKCSQSYRPTTEEFIQKAKSAHQNKYDYSLVSYINSKIKIKLICNKHDFIFQQTPDNHLQGKGCPKCALENIKSLQKLTILNFINRARTIHYNKYTYNNSIYINSHTKLKIECPDHGIFNQTPASHLNGAGCPLCKESHGERYISQILDKFNIQYNREYKILAQPYKYDFYLPEYDIYIEYHGIQHYRPIKYFGGSDKFKQTQRRDKSKIELIKRSTGLLIVIKYTFNTLEKIEDELIRLFSYIHPEFFNDKEITKQTITVSKLYLIDDGIGYKRK